MSSPSESLGSREIRNHRTSIGAPKVRSGKPNRSRITDVRPSAATVRYALTSIGHRTAGPHTGDDAAVAGDVGDLVRSEQSEGGQRLPLLGQQVQQVPLRHESDVRVLDPQPAEVREGERSVGERDSQPMRITMGQFFELVGRARARPAGPSSMGERCRRGNRAGSRRVSPATPHESRDGPATVRASIRQGHHRRRTRPS